MHIKDETAEVEMGEDALVQERLMFEKIHKKGPPPRTAELTVSKREDELQDIHRSSHERPTRERKKRYGRYDFDRSTDSDNNSLKQHSSGSKFNSLIMAKRIKNENSRMLQSLESRFNILQRNETKILNRIEG